MSSEDRATEFGQAIALGCTYNALLVEASRGSLPTTFPYPVQLEPVYEPFDPSQMYRQGRPTSPALPTRHQPSWKVYRLRPPGTDQVDWSAFESLVSSMSTLTDVASFEVIGTKHVADFFVGSASTRPAKAWRTAWRSTFPELVSVGVEDPFIRHHLDYSKLTVIDIYPRPPYHRRMSVAPAVSPLVHFLGLLPGLDEDDWAFYQVLFTPVEHDWHRNVKAMIHAESILRERSPFGKSTAGTVKNPSKPLFAVRVRFGSISTQAVVDHHLLTLAGAFHYDGNPFLHRGKQAFTETLRTQNKIVDMLRQRVSYTTGMLLTSDEVATFVHVPCQPVPIHIDFAKGFPVPDRLLHGARRLGVNSARGFDQLVRFPDGSQNKCMYHPGSSRSGKTTFMLNQVCELASDGQRVGYVDPHREAAFQLLGLIDPKHAERVVFLDFDDPEHVVGYNCFQTSQGEHGRLALEITNSYQHLFDAASYHRMNHFLRLITYGLFELGENLIAIPTLLSRTPQGDALRREIVRRTKNPEAARFWDDEFYTHPPVAFNPILNRTSALFMDDHAARIFSTKENKVSIDRIMTEGQILIVALPASVELSSLIGGMLIAQFQKAAFARTGTADARKPFYLYVDEFHRFSTGRILESIINECVKGGLHVCLANQETGQLSDEMLKAVLSVPNIFVFRVNLLDARRLAPIFDGKVTVEEILSLGVGEVFARIDNDIVDFKCPPPPGHHDPELAKHIIEESRKRYYTRLAPVAHRQSKTRRREIDTF